ncbi:MAG: hypothetical protein IKI63_02195 [Clostridia bacterium]|nr:hypothetical protein [Clostridia bacterium]
MKHAMKHAVKGLAIVLAIALLMPTVLVQAAPSKTDEIVAMLNESDLLKGVNGTATHEDGAIEIGYSAANPSYSSMSFPYENTVVECIPDEITDYEEAGNATSQVICALQLLYAALELNGFSEDQITAFFQSEDNQPTMEVNGFELKPLGESQTYTSDDGSSTITVTPVSVTFDVSKANLNQPGDEAFTPTDTTVQDVVDHLAADDSFTSLSWDDGTVAYENTIYSEDGEIIVNHTEYTYNYHCITFDCEDDVLTYEATEIADYDEACAVSESQLWAMVILQYALKANGYSTEEIAAFLNSEDINPTFERNGIEFRELGEDQTFEGEWGDQLTVAPFAIKIDFAKVNMDAADPESREDAPEASEQPATPTTPASPETGDSANPALMIVLLGAATLTLALTKRQKAAE